MDTNILELAQRGRNAGLSVTVRAPATDIPDTQALMGIPLDPQLVALFRATNGCNIGSVFVFNAHDGVEQLLKTNIHGRILLDYIPFLHDVLLCVGYGNMCIELAPIPTLADDQGRQPIVIVDTNDVPCIMPLASTLNRALELVVDDEISLTQDVTGMGEAFPFNVAHLVAQDARLMQLLNDGAFDDLGGGVVVDLEWCEELRTA